MTDWEKIPKAPFYLEVRRGTYRTSYRINYRAHGLNLRETLDGNFKTWKDALTVADKRISEARFGETPEERALTRSEALCDEIVALKQSKSAATYEQTEIFFRKHIKPFLNEQCPYAADLNATVWLNYKNQKRIENPKVALFNHWKFFTMLFKYAHQKGLLKSPVKLEFDEKKEDRREKGRVIPDEHFRAFTRNAFRVWKDRAILQRLTGQRPGVIRRLRKDSVNLETRVVHIHPEESKNRREYSFILPEVCIGILRARMAGDSPYFFPNERDPSKPMDKSLTGWRSALKKAGIAVPYTPHDVRHSFLTEKFKTASNPALVCYQCDLSLEEAMATYIHFTAADTGVIAAESDARAGELLG